MSGEISLRRNRDASLQQLFSKAQEQHSDQTSLRVQLASPNHARDDTARHGH